jgi:hypothetical protein
VVVQAPGRHPEVQRLVPPEQHHLARPERRCSAGFLDVAAVLPEALRPQAARLAPLMELHPAQPRVPRPVRAAGVRPAVLAVVRCPARPSAAAAQMVRVRRRAEVPVAQPLAAEPKGAPRSAEQPAALAEAAAEVQREEEVPPALAAQPKVAPAVLAAWDAAAGPQPAVASVAAGVRQPEEAAAPDVAVVALPQAVVRAVAVVAQPQGVARAVAAARLRGAVAGPVSEVRRPAARDAQGGPPLAAAWAAVPLSIRLREDRPAPSPSARSAHAREVL